MENIWVPLAVAFITSEAFRIIVQEIRDRAREKRNNPLQQMKSVVSAEIKPLEAKIDSVAADVEALKAPVEFMGKTNPVLLKGVKTILENGDKIGWNHSTKDSLKSVNEIIDGVVAGAAVIPPRRKRKAVKAEGETA